MKRVTTVNRWYVLFAACGLLSVGACVDEGPDAPPLPGALGQTAPVDAGAAGAAGSGGGAAGTGGSGAGTGGAAAGTGGAAGSAGAAGGVGDTDAGTDAG